MIENYINVADRRRRDVLLPTVYVDFCCLFVYFLIFIIFLSILQNKVLQ